MKEIPLRPLKQKKVALVDDEDFEELSRYKWYVAGGWNTFYARRSASLQDKSVLMHRLIMQTPEGMQTDHKNGDGLDNRRENLRVCTRSQNRMNSGRQANNTSGYKGVNLEKSVGKWRARIMVSGKHKSLGLFTTKEEAYAAYCVACVKFHGEFAVL